MFREIVTFAASIVIIDVAGADSISFRKEGARGCELVVKRTEIPYVIPKELRPLFDSGQLSPPQHVYRYSLERRCLDEKPIPIWSWEIPDPGLMPSGKPDGIITVYEDPAGMLLIYKSGNQIFAQMLLCDAGHDGYRPVDDRARVVFHDSALRFMESVLVEGAWYAKTLRITITDSVGDKTTLMPMQRLDWVPATQPKAPQSSTSPAKN